MSLIIRRSAGGPGVISNGKSIVRVVKVDPDGTVHLAFNAERKVQILREELVHSEDREPAEYGNQK